MLKKVISTSLLIAWLIVIFIFSNESGDVSKNTSDKLTRNTINTVSNITGKEYTNFQKDRMVDDYRFIVRKMAHFTLYFILGIITIITFKIYGLGNKVLIYSLLFCFLYAVLDEIHQIFSDGRSFKMLDILIDTSGSILGSNLVYLIKNKNDKKLAFLIKI